MEALERGLPLLQANAPVVRLPCPLLKQCHVMLAISRRIDAIPDGGDTAAPAELLQLIGDKLRKHTCASV